MFIKKKKGKNLANHFCSNSVCLLFFESEYRVKEHNGDLREKEVVTDL